ncbi:MAG: Gfo/Idh/MocA family oxidoreductase [Candidatus Binatus sp.]|uniref:Gfo/Idh/MocA family protein n=1 Tax=Candidatus Binatus sp. TaxID=2811406 RepID=UPI00271C26C5|nr:Gfo/Idh/MocA family oxidoreductase [Candidatus Binatus sp.]MDO8432692.1 Gfo/Idh/MocA family oxidoreductase [Candidatus Binatus sp.]
MSLIEQVSNGNGSPLAQSVERSAKPARLKAIAVVGLGYWGPNWVRVISQLQQADQIVCCDLSAARREQIAKLYPEVKAVESVDDVLNDPDVEAVVVATPVNSHYEIARRFLEEGKAVLVEKPLAISLKQAAELVRLSRRRQRTLMVGHTFEYSAPVLKARELIESGELGEILYISSVRANLGLFQRDINVAWDLATHDISIILMLLGQMPESVACQGQSHYRSKVEDVALLTLHFPNGVIAFIHVSWLDPNKIRRATIVGSHKMVVYDDTALQEKIRIYDKGVTFQPHYDTYGEFQLSYRYGDIQIPRIEEAEPLKVECEHFIDCIHTGKVPKSDGVSGLRVVSVLEAADISLSNGGQRVPVSQEAFGWE